MRTISIQVFCDEITEQTLPFAHDETRKWSYIGALIVPSDRKAELIRQLNTGRCLLHNDWSACTLGCPYHERNGTEVHYQQIREADVYHIAKRWVEFFLCDKVLTYYYILGINLSRLNLRFFGESKGHERAAEIYNRFFRTVLSKSIKSYFSKYDKIIIDQIYHDTSDLQDHERFPWHAIKFLNESSDKLSFGCTSIQFIDSDHDKSGVAESQLIQYIDLLLGLTMNCFHASSRSKKAVELTMAILPIVERLSTKPGNVNSSYRFVNRLAVDFFPKHKIGSDDNMSNQALRLDSFYKDRQLRIREVKQPELFDMGAM